MNTPRPRMGLVALVSISVQGCTVSADPNELTIGLTLGVGVYAVANILYAKMRLEDEPSGVKRLTAFLCGLPTTFLLFLVVEPRDRWMQARLDRTVGLADEEDPVAIRREFEQELSRIRAADRKDGLERDLD